MVAASRNNPRATRPSQLSRRRGVCRIGKRRAGRIHSGAGVTMSFGQPNPSFPIVAVRSFIDATRDPGYKSTGAAIAELVDNAIEAEATEIDIQIEPIESAEGKQVAIRVA